MCKYVYTYLYIYVSHIYVYRYNVCPTTVPIVPIFSSSPSGSFVENRDFLFLIGFRGKQFSSSKVSVKALLRSKCGNSGIVERSLRNFGPPKCWFQGFKMVKFPATEVAWRRTRMKSSNCTGMTMDSGWLASVYTSDILCTHTHYNHPNYTCSCQIWSTIDSNWLERYACVQPFFAAFFFGALSGHCLVRKGRRGSKPPRRRRKRRGQRQKVVGFVRPHLKTSQIGEMIQFDLTTIWTQMGWNLKYW